MEKEFVSYEQALALKELGFDENYLAWYHKGKLTFNKLYNLQDLNGHARNSSAPIKQQAFRFFQEKYGLHFYSFEIMPFDDNLYYPRKVWIGKINETFIDINNGLAFNHFKTYEEAEESCLDKLIEIANEKNK